SDSLAPALGLSPLLAVAVMAAVALLVFGATLFNDRHGVGSGFAVAIAALSSGQLYAVAKNLYSGLGNELVTPVTFPLVAGIFAGAGFVAVKVTAVPSSAGELPRWAPRLASTLQPVTAAAALLALPATMSLVYQRGLQARL